jgi:hypothetical protein
VKFMVIRRADKNTEAGVLPTTELVDAMLKYHKQMEDAGILIEGMGLHPSSRGTRISIAGGSKPAVIDGPFAETKELIAGFSLIDVMSKDEAIEWVKRWPVEDGPVELEIRQVFEPEDFGPALTPAHREQVRRLKDGVSKK